MIKGLMGRGCVIVEGGNTSLPYISMNTENPIQGMVRIWGTDLQVFSGIGWSTIPSSYATAELDNETIMLLEWARKKKREEEVLLSLPSDNPAVKIARENINRIKQELARAEEQLKITELLSKEYDETTS